MKKNAIWIAAMCIMALLAGCSSSAAPAATPEPTPEAAPAPSYDKAELMLSEFSGAELGSDVLIHLNAEGQISGQDEITLTYENITEQDFTYTALQRLEVLLDGEWYIVPDAQDFVTMQLFTVPAGSSVDDTFRFADRYEPLEPGSFRIVKNFVAYDGVNSISTLEFTVE